MSANQMSASCDNFDIPHTALGILFVPATSSSTVAQFDEASTVKFQANKLRLNWRFRVPATKTKFHIPSGINARRTCTANEKIGD
jgi:hypothetical protein